MFAIVWCTLSAMQNRRVALLRGINVGTAKRVAMADLRTLVESLGYGDVRTLLNSGNVIFTAAPAVRGDAAARIERGLASLLGVASRVTVLTGAELEEIVAGNPLLDVADDPSRLMVTVLARPADSARLRPLAGQDWSPEVLSIGRRVTYAWMPRGVIDSRVLKALSRTLGDGITTRNWATILKLHALACAAATPPPARGARSSGSKGRT
jgi:uncharacterized protein (DUF1697 family)